MGQIARFTLTLFSISLLFTANSHAISLAQTDTFEGGTTMNWGVGANGAPHPAPPTVVEDGGPTGAGDGFLLLTSIGAGTGGPNPGGRMTAFNFLGQWSGDYTAAGVTRITMDVNNMGATDLYLRLEVGSGDFTGPPTAPFVLTDAAFSTNAWHVAAGSGWQSIWFDIASTDLTSLVGSVDEALADVAFLRLFDNVAPAFPGPEVVASLGVDNISTVPVPAAAWLMLSGLAAFGARVRRRT